MKKIIFCLISCLMLVFMYDTAYAINSRLSVEEMDENMQKSILEGMQIKLTNEYVMDEPIICFNTNNKDKIVLGLGDSIKKKIYVLDLNGEFKYGYEFLLNGTFVVEMHDETINIIKHRGQSIISLDGNHECAGVATVVDSWVNDNYLRKWDAEEQKIGERSYYLDSSRWIDYLNAGYAQLICKDEDGNEMSLYELELKYSVSGFIWRLKNIIFICLIALFYLLKKRRN